MESVNGITAGMVGSFGKRYSNGEVLLRMT